MYATTHTLGRGILLLKISVAKRHDLLSIGRAAVVVGCSDCHLSELPSFKFILLNIVSLAIPDVPSSFLSVAVAPANFQLELDMHTCTCLHGLGLWACCT